MSAAKMGRPTNSPKDVMVRVRMDKTTLSKLDKCVDLKGSNRSQVIRDAIVLVYSKIKKYKKFRRHALLQNQKILHRAFFENQFRSDHYAR